MSAWSPEDEFASDLVRDLAIARLLITSGWHLLDQAGAPRWALRAARLACQARLAAAGAGSELERTTIQAVFDELAKEHGSRWAEVPMEALLTLGNAQDALTRAWPALHYRAARRGFWSDAGCAGSRPWSGPSTTITPSRAGWLTPVWTSW
jgi:hypothetical protein